MKTVMEPFFSDVDRTTSGAISREAEAWYADPYLHLWANAGTSGACAFNENEDSPVCLYVLGTTTGLVTTTAQEGYRAELGEIRRRSSLTWDQLAGIFGVNRRSLHFWARGARPSADNAERIGGVLDIIRRFDTGDPSRTREQLLQPRWDGLSVVHLLCERRDEDALALLTAARSRSSRDRRPRRPPALPTVERERRRGFTPVRLLDARHDDAPELGRPLGAIPIPGLRV